MSKAYWVSSYRVIHDPAKLAAYAELAGPAIQARGGQFLARGTAHYASGIGVVERTVIVQWPDLVTAEAAYQSPEYQAALEALSDGVERDFRIIEGV